MSNPQALPLDQIISGKNPRGAFDEKDIAELALSVGQHGIIHAITVRPIHGGKYEIVCGERRWRAAKIAGLSEIQASIRELSDDEAFELSITENLQRKDVHPLDEAAAYKAYQERNKTSLEDLVLKFAKGKEYIAQRLSFNALIPELKKDFFAGTLMIGHAVMLARLQPADQKTVMASSKSHHYKGGESYDSVEEMKGTIESEVMHELGQVGFDKKDPKLIPKAGPCTTCQKRSGGGLLFGDIKEKDRCFDGACFEAKTKAFLLKQIDELVLSANPMPVVGDYSIRDLDKDVKKKLESNKINILKEYDDYNEAPKSSKTSTMALKVCGTHAGRIIGITLKTTDKAKKAKAAIASGSTEETVESIDAQIEGIKERGKRGAELDAEKVHKKITDQLTGLKPFFEVDPERSNLSAAEECAMYFILYGQMEYSDRQKVADALKIPRKKEYVGYRVDDKLIAEKLAGAPPEVLAFIARSAIKDKMIGNSILATGPSGFLVRKIAEDYPGIPIAQFEADQLAVATKRTDNAKKRIAELQARKKELTPKKTKPAKPAKEKAAKKGDKALVDMSEEDFDALGHE